VLPNAVLKMSEQFLSLFFTHGVCRYNANGMHFLKKKNIFLKHGKSFDVDIKYACAKSIFMDCNKAFTSKFDFHTHTQVCVVTNKSQERTLSCQNFTTPSMQTVITIVVIIQNTHSAPLWFYSAFIQFVEQSEFAERFWNCQTERTFILASGYWISVRVEP
jgi:hypothetical protein